MYGNIPETRIEELIDFVGLSGQETKKVKGYSLGMKQRLALARTLINNPELIILDEPSNGLDPQGMLQLYDMVRFLAQKKQVTFIISSHLLHDMEDLCTDVLILNKGKSILQGKTLELISDSSNMVEIDVKENGMLADLIKELKGIELVRQQGERFVIKMEKVTLDSLLRELVHRNIHTKYLSVRKKSLQDLFLELTGGK